MKLIGQLRKSMTEIISWLSQFYVDELTKKGYHLWCQERVFGITTFAIDHMSRKSEIVFQNCFSDWYFCFNKPFIPNVSSWKTLVLLLTAVKLSVSNWLTIIFLEPFHITYKSLPKGRSVFVMLFILKFFCRWS